MDDEVIKEALHFYEVVYELKKLGKSQQDLKKLLGDDFELKYLEGYSVKQMLDLKQHFEDRATKPKQDHPATFRKSLDV